MNESSWAPWILAMAILFAVFMIAYVFVRPALEMVLYVIAGHSIGTWINRNWGPV